MADVDLTVTVPEVWQTKVVDSFTTIAGANILIHINKPGLNARWKFTIAPKGASETLVQFGSRFLRELGIAYVNAVDKAEDEDRYKAAIAAIPPPISDVPDNILI